MKHTKYKPYETVKLENREWPNKSIEKAPIWCSVDLRDGNQALPIPMGIEQKLKYFKLLVDMGYKEIEVGFPSASETEYNFVRRLIEDNHIPDDVTIQVLVQSRQHLIEKTFESLKGAKNAIVHFYNSTSIQQRNIVFKKSKSEIVDIAVNAAKLMLEYEKNYPETNFRYQYSPESFPGTEIDYALEICEAVIDVIKPIEDKKLIINIPTTVEMALPNVFADQIEWFSKNIKKRDSIILCIHPHNDRGGAISSSEMALLAGAERVEGTLFGNGERTGNLDNVALGLNLYTHGIDPEINFENLDSIIEIYKECTGLDIHPRHPYAGELVYTAFSGSHQDAIRKGMLIHEENEEFWDVPYLPIDPGDLGRSYEPIIRINSQSGKGGIAYILESNFGYQLPKIMHPEFSKVVQVETDKTGKELTPNEIHELFRSIYLAENSKYKLMKSSYKTIDTDEYQIECVITIDGIHQCVVGKGNGPISAFCNGLKELLGIEFKVEAYFEHALGSGVDAMAAAYVQISIPDGQKHFGVGLNHNTTSASIEAVLSSLNIIDL